MAKVPVRTCVCCRKRAAKSELQRFVLRDGAIVWDSSGRQPGRGVYVHPSWACWSRMSEVRLWERAFRQPPKENWKDNLANCMEAIRGVLPAEKTNVSGSNLKRSKRKVRL